MSLINNSLIDKEIDEFYSLAAELIANNSTCIKAKVGALIVDKNGYSASGYNRTAGNIHNCKEYTEYYSNLGVVSNHSDYHDKYEIHAEMDAIINFLAKHSKDKIKGATIYCTLRPCWNCTKYLIELGIKRIVFFDYKKTKTAIDNFQWIINLQSANIDWLKIER